ncbi:MAG: hypothetical protein ACK4L7_08875, partial [Flavobacteriales bacterium]
VVGGAYPDALSAQAKMAGVKEQVYVPQPEAVAIYRELYDLYCELHDAFGVKDNESQLFSVMKSLKSIQERVNG